jgi:hypothetical protein
MLPYAPSGMVPRSALMVPVHRTAFGQVAAAAPAASALPVIPTWAYALSAVSMAVSAYHGYKRDKSVGWAVVWGILGGMAPVLVPVIALAEGYAKPATPNRKRRRLRRRR